MFLSRFKNQVTPDFIFIGCKKTVWGQYTCYLLFFFFFLGGELANVCLMSLQYHLNVSLPVLLGMWMRPPISKMNCVFPVSKKSWVVPKLRSGCWDRSLIIDNQFVVCLKRRLMIIHWSLAEITDLAWLRIGLVWFISEGAWLFQTSAWCSLIIPYTSS